MTRSTKNAGPIVDGLDDAILIEPFQINYVRARVRFLVGTYVWDRGLVVVLVTQSVVLIAAHVACLNVTTTLKHVCLLHL